MQLIGELWKLFKLVVPLVIAYYIMSGLGAFESSPPPIVVKHSSPAIDGFGAKSDVRDEVRAAAQRALEGLYDRGIYGATRCGGRDVDGEFLMRCYPINDEDIPGGLYVIKGGTRRLFSVWPINGTAQQHMENHSFPKSKDRVIDVFEWKGAPINIQFALATIK